MAHLKLHKEVIWGVREGEKGKEGKDEEKGREGKGRENGLGFCSYWSAGWRPRVSRAHSLLVNLKYRSGNLQYGKRKNK